MKTPARLLAFVAIVGVVVVGGHFALNGTLPSLPGQVIVTREAPVAVAADEGVGPLCGLLGEYCESGRAECCSEFGLSCVGRTCFDVIANDENAGAPLPPVKPARQRYCCGSNDLYLSACLKVPGNDVTCETWSDEQPGVPNDFFEPTCGGHCRIPEPQEDECLKYRADCGESVGRDDPNWGLNCCATDHGGPAMECRSFGSGWECRYKQ